MADPTPAPGAPPPSARAAEEAARILSGETRALARLISRLENRDPSALEPMRLLLARTGRAKVVGVTGPPGSGKSSLVDRLIRELRARNLRVAVLAVDPSSPFTGGAILGDRLRMQEHATDPGVFLRSLASRGHLGGLSKATSTAVRALDAAGYDVVIIETVGVGQSEVDIVRVADVVVLVAVPGLGDDIQAIKAGIMEIGDVFVVNKADREGADRVVREIRSMLETAAALAMSRAGSGADGAAELPRDASAELHHGALTGPGQVGAAAGSARLGRGASGGGGASPGSASALSEPRSGGAPALNGFLLDETGHPILPPVLKTVASTGEGCAELLEAILGHHAELHRSGRLAERRLAAAKAEIRDLLQLRVAELLAARPGLEAELGGSVLDKELDPWEAADRLFDSLFASAAAPEAGPRGGAA